MIRATPGILASSGYSNLSGYLNKSTTTTSGLTGTTVNTLVYSFLIPANTVQVGDFLQYNICGTKTGTLGGSSMRVYINTSNSLTGSTNLGLYTVGSTTLYQVQTRWFKIKGATDTSILSTGSVLVRDNSANALSSSINID